MNNTPVASSYNFLVFQTQGLDIEEERALALNVQLNDCTVSAKRLAESHFRYVAAIARKYAAYYKVEFDDLLQQGVVGLLTAIKKYCPDKFPGVRLAGFSAFYIKGEIIEFVLNNVRSYRMATTRAQRKLFFNLNKYRVDHTRPLNCAEIAHIATELNVTERDVRVMENKFYVVDPSIDQDDTGSVEAELGRTYYDPARAVERERHEEHLLNQIQQAVESLDERSRDIVYHRVIAEEKQTLKEMAVRLGVSAERVRQLENQAMAKVRSIVETLA